MSVAPILLKLRRRLRGTTLVTAWTWAAAIPLLWFGVWVASCWGFDDAPGAIDQMWYGLAVLLLCPPIAVLGAKRPMSRAWGGFVLLPLLLVLGWPAASAWGGSFTRSGWSLETPVLAGFLLILCMGLGNYMGTRLTLPAILWGAGALLLAGSLCPVTAARLPDPLICRTLATWCLVAAAWIAEWGCTRRSPIAGERFDALWNDFQNTFGIVWSRRIQDHFNDVALRSRWNVQLMPAGIRPRSQMTEGPQTPEAITPADSAIEESLRWHLRRFVDPDWIDARLPSNGSHAL